MIPQTVTFSSPLEYKKYERYVHALLAPDEEIELVVPEVRMWYVGSVIAPAVIFATNKRILITRRDVFHVNKSYKIIKYSNITSINMEHGIKYCSVNFGVYGDETGSSGRKKWVSGIKYQDAEALVKFVDNESSKTQQTRRANEETEFVTKITKK